MSIEFLGTQGVRKVGHVIPRPFGHDGLSKAKPVVAEGNLRLCVDETLRFAQADVSSSRC